MHPRTPRGRRVRFGRRWPRFGRNLCKQARDDDNNVVRWSTWARIPRRSRVPPRLRGGKMRSASQRATFIAIMRINTTAHPPGIVCLSHSRDDLKEDASDVVAYLTQTRRRANRARARALAIFNRSFYSRAGPLRTRYLSREFSISIRLRQPRSALQPSSADAESRLVRPSIFELRRT